MAEAKQPPAGAEVLGQQEFMLDLDAFAPVVGAKTVRFKKQTYPVVSLLDLPIKHSLEVLRIEEDMEGKSLADQLKRARRQIELLVPTFPQADLDDLTPNQIIAVARHAARAGAVPQTAGEVSSD